MKFAVMVFVICCCAVVGSAQEDSQSRAGIGLYLRSDALGALRSRIVEETLAQTLYTDIYSVARACGGTQRENARIAKSASFCALVALDASGTPLCDSAVSLLRTRAITLLCGLAPAVPTASSDVQWRAVELMDFAEAYGFLLADGISDSAAENQLAEFARQASVSVQSFLSPKNNLTLKLAASLGMAALVLEHSGDAQKRARTEQWLKNAMESIENILWRVQSSAGGTGYSEGPYYFRYAMLQLLPFFDALDARNSMVRGNMQYPTYNPATDPRFLAQCDWITSLHMPDGRLAAFEDTYLDMGFPELAVLARIGPRDPAYAWMHRTTSGAAWTERELSDALNGTTDFRIQYLVAGARPVPDVGPARSRFDPAAGYAVLRSARDDGEAWFALIGKHGIARTHGSLFGSGHKQANEGAFIFHAGGELLALEPGYPSYEQRDTVLFGRSHNVMLVDGRGPDSISFTGALYGTDSYIVDTLGAARVSRLTVRSAYESSQFHRTAWMLPGGLVILRDDAASSRERVFTHQLHGNASASDGFSLDTKSGRGIWRVGDMALHAMSRSTDASQLTTFEERAHSPKYRTLASHAALVNSVKSRGTTLLTALVPSRSAESNPLLLSRSQNGLATIETGIAGVQTTIAGARSTPGRIEIRCGGAQYTGDAATLLVVSSHADTILCFDRATAITKDERLLYFSSVASSGELRLRGDTIDVIADVPAPAMLHIGIRNVPASILGSGFTSPSVQGSALVLDAAAGRVVISILASGRPLSAQLTEHIADARGGLTISPSVVRTAMGNTIRLRCEGVPIEHAQYTIHNTLGIRVDAQISPTARGENTATIALPALSAGMYWITLRTGSQVLRQRFIVR